MPFLNTVRLPLIASALVALLTACAGSPPTAPTTTATPVSAKGAPQIPEQVSNPAWEADMQRFEAADAQSPPPRGGALFIGSSSIRFWDTLAQDFPGVTGLMVAEAVADAGAPVAWLPGFDAAEAYLGSRLRDGDLVLTLGAGDVDALGRRLVAAT